MNGTFARLSNDFLRNGPKARRNLLQRDNLRKYQAMKTKKNKNKEPEMAFEMNNLESRKVSFLYGGKRFRWISKQEVKKVEFQKRVEWHNQSIPMYRFALSLATPS